MTEYRILFAIYETFVSTKRLGLIISQSTNLAKALGFGVLLETEGWKVDS